MSFGGRHQLEAIFLPRWLLLPASPATETLGFMQQCGRFQARRGPLVFGEWVSAELACVLWPGECRSLVSGAHIRWYLLGVNRCCGSLSAGPFASGRGSRSPGRLCGDAAGSRGVSREREFRYSQRGKEENRRSAGVHVLCPPALQTLSHLMSPTHCFRNGWMKSNI